MEIIEDYSKQNTRYLELRSTPKAIGSIFTKELYIQTILEAIVEMQQKIPNIKVCFLVSVNRTAPEQDAKEAIDLILKIKDENQYGCHLVGLELSGDPRGGSFDTFKD